MDTMAGETPDSLARQSKALSHLDNEEENVLFSIRCSIGSRLPNSCCKVGEKARDHREPRTKDDTAADKSAAGDRLPLAPTQCRMY